MRGLIIRKEKKIPQKVKNKKLKLIPVIIIDSKTFGQLQSERDHKWIKVDPVTIKKRLYSVKKLQFLQYNNFFFSFFRNLNSMKPIIMKKHLF